LVTPLGVYLAQADGSQQNTVADKALFIGVDPQGEQCLIQPLTEDGVSPSLVVVNLQNQTQKTLTESYAADYPCDSNRCGAIWLKDGKQIGLILKQKNVNYLDEKNIFLIQNDNLEQKQLTRLGVEAPPMFLYQVYSDEFIYWEKDEQGIMGGTFSVSLNDGKITEVALGVEKVFSPTGNLVAFQKRVDDLGYRTALMVAKLDGSEEKTIFTPQEGDELKDYVWSPGWHSNGF
jgi:Tol biopolymer transport system component